MGTVEDLTELRAYVNRHSVSSAAAPNAVNSTNDRFYEAALDGLTPSPAVSYLLNLTDMTLKDYRSIGAYNAMNIAYYAIASAYTAGEHPTTASGRQRGSRVDSDYDDA